MCLRIQLSLIKRIVDSTFRCYSGETLLPFYHLFVPYVHGLSKQDITDYKKPAIFIKANKENSN